ncbi:MmcQ/YjbR family DNA-binding protein [Paenibacillus alkaliterrae]|uniref:MmcQ/YjbR family DNA-binding protein n=1 Tax=Paenibacillus alkaliterrae TaxID=320909 RepID=UPI001F2723A5|nr:MmcQ/YjbR family DNA-binding protein [Paenibacillus alkaliterrae]MCF2937159.1 MmcQ/YjbR family DNA-binding protein [Paenibacillus alkaliterrae]
MDAVEKDYSPILKQIRMLCLSFPATSERLSHGAPTFFVNEKKSFVQYHHNHHGDGIIGLWCAAPAGVQTLLIESDSDIYFRPAYVGHLGWVGLRLDRNAEWTEIQGVIQEAYLTRAPKKYCAMVKNS